MAVFFQGLVYGVRQLGIFLVISRSATSHAQSIIAHSIMYQSLQTPPQLPLHLHRPPSSTKAPPSLTPPEGQASQISQELIKICQFCTKVQKQKMLTHTH